ncbi:shikimate dehydrogenase [Maricaulis sp.]|uniref:shikimate dehydrogenase n=1 Tax=Maricaulis sp. TaxID=1486257 RepID=UPI001B16B8CE|nr:shikimate dehydrogenase [Maricaulis sp.]MBO6763411.1 shikimate dehydrogenase [Maricaulis sp.]
MTVGLTGRAVFAGVVGDPVSHSLSPRLMGHWIRTLGLDAAYLPFAVPPSGFEAFVRGLAGTQASGLNVTLPHKEAALALADRATPAAKAIGAANLLTFHPDGILVDNSDATGFLNALEPAKPAYHQSTALVLGAGGAARALVHALVTSGVNHLIITNRTADRARALAAELAPDAAIVAWDDRDAALADADIVVNATALGLKGENDLAMDWGKARSGAIVFDSVYTPLVTGFLAGARQAGLKTIDGLDMLIGQARPSFRAFFGREAPADPPVRPVLLEVLGARP